MAVTSVQITGRESVSKGESFGVFGPYELISGAVKIEIDPLDSNNGGIADLDLAPRGPRGRVELTSQFGILRPKEAMPGGRLLFDVPNRGRNTTLAAFNRAASNARGQTGFDAGDGFLMRHGFTVAWCGWQHDIPEQAGVVAFKAPLAERQGQPVIGKVMCEYQPAQYATVMQVKEILPSPSDKAYEPLDLQEPEAVLSVMDHIGGMRRMILRSDWHFVAGDSGSPGDVSIRLAEGFAAGKFYQLVYTAKGAVVTGAGFLAVRDFVAWLRYSSASTDNPCAGSLEHAYAYGASQSGHFLRHMLHLGMNQDENGRPVFDAVFALIASARRGEFNMRFGQPAKTVGTYVGSLFPFSYTTQTDLITGKTDGILKRSEEQGVAPKIFAMDSSAEYWSREASLIHTDVEGKRDVTIPDNVRIYHLAGTQHANGALPEGDVTASVRLRHPLNSIDRGPAVRAALVNLDCWVTAKEPPPDSRYPRIDDQSASHPEEVMKYFQRLNDVQTPLHMPPLRRLDFGPDAERGVLTELPPQEGEAFQHLVPAIDSDGNELTGIRLPDVSVPLATFTGWNVRHPDSGMPDEWLWRAGATIRFARTANERQASDPRPAIEERYESKAEYLALIRAAAEKLVFERFVLQEDVEHIVRLSELRWELMAATDETVLTGPTFAG